MMHARPLLIDGSNGCRCPQRMSVYIVEAQKLLGIYIDNTLSWTHQVSYIRNRVNSKIALLKRLSYYITHDMKVMFYNAYIQSTFDYCCPIWGSSKKRKLLLKSLKNE